MKLIQIALVAAGTLFALAACDTTNGGKDSGDTGDEACAGDPLIQEISNNCDDGGEWCMCDSATDMWTYQARTDNWTGGATVKMAETADTVSNPIWDEVHPLDSVDYGESPECYDIVKVSLPSVYPDFADQVDGTNTLFTCTQNNPQGEAFLDRITWEFEVRDADNVKTDCAVVGHDTSYYSADSCLDWN